MEISPLNTNAVRGFTLSLFKTAKEYTKARKEWFDSLDPGEKFWFHLANESVQQPPDSVSIQPACSDEYTNELNAYWESHLRLLNSVYKLEAQICFEHRNRIEQSETKAPDLTRLTNKMFLKLYDSGQTFNQILICYRVSPEELQELEKDDLEKLQTIFLAIGTLPFNHSSTRFDMMACNLIAELRAKHLDEVSLEGMIIGRTEG